MNIPELQWFAIISLLFNSSQGKICDLSDIECTTNGAKQTYKTILGAFKDEPDPIHMEELVAELAVFKCKLNNITLAGLSNCVIEKLACRQNDSTFDYSLRCPHLVLRAYFESQGPIGGLPLDGKGETEITTDDYLIICNGVYEAFMSEEDQKLHVAIKTYDLDFDAKGKVTFGIFNLVSGHKEQFDVATKFLNENWMEVEKLFRKPLANVLLRKFFDNYSKALKSMPVEDILLVVE